MKNDIKTSLDKILPTDTEKNRMLNNVLNKKRKSKIIFNIFIPLIPVVATFILCISVSINNNTKTSLSKSRELSININNNNYCEKGIWNDKVNDLEKLDGILPGGTVYKTKNNTILIYSEGKYMEYVICEGERNEKN